MRRGKPGAVGDRADFTSWDRLTRRERDTLNRARSARRAGQDLRRKIRTADLRRLLTFTNGAEGDGWESLGECVSHVMEWYVTVGWEFLKDSPVAVVAERGEGHGRIHAHAAVRKGYFIDYNGIRESWTAFLITKGYQPHNSQWHRFHAGDEQGDHKNGFSSARVCGDYMAKYLAKSFQTDDRGLFQKRYRCRGVVPLEPRRMVGFTLADVPELVANTFPGAATVDWYESPDGDYGGWFIEVDAAKR